MYSTNFNEPYITPKISKDYYSFLDIQPELIINYLDNQRKNQLIQSQKEFELNYDTLPLPEPPLNIKHDKQSEYRQFKEISQDTDEQSESYDNEFALL